MVRGLMDGAVSWTTKYPLVMTPQPEGGYTVTSPLLLLQRYAVSGLTGGAVRG